MFIAMHIPYVSVLDEIMVYYKYMYIYYVGVERQGDLIQGTNNDWFDMCVSA